MSRIGILLHTYHVEAVDWEGIVWGDPNAEDTLGTVPKLAEILLGIPVDDEVFSIIGEGPSMRDGVYEGTYTKQFLMARLDELARFPRIQRKLVRLDQGAQQVFWNRIGALVVGPRIDNTAQEVAMAAELFGGQGVDQVIQIAAMTHAPRCVREQGVARMLGIIPLSQPWSTVMSDTNFAGATPADVDVAEPAHRGDDPLRDHSLSWPQTTARYWSLPPRAKWWVLTALHRLMNEAETANPNEL